MSQERPLVGKGVAFINAKPIVFSVGTSGRTKILVADRVGQLLELASMFRLRFLSFVIISLKRLDLWQDYD